MAIKVLDITPLISPRLGVWPGDVSFARQVSCDVEKGHNITLSSITTTVHLGAHADAPNHYARGQVGISDRPLEPYMGLCQVIEVRTGIGMRVSASDINVPIEAPRVLFKTGSFPDPDHFNEDFNGLSSGVIRKLAHAGVILVGVDTPSVDLLHDERLESHSTIAQYDMAILEGVVLRDVLPGVYTLIALPLRIEGADASPVRAVLIEGKIQEWV